MIKKVDGCKNNTGKLSTTKLGGHIPWGYLMSMMETFDRIENKHDAYRGEDWMKRFYEPLREHTINIINFEENKMIPWSN